uniref:Uncharacterized protein n=1 Tax=Human herpesvirus 1 TaxID=10298 RepID=A0A2Z4HD29_HHV1|nr:hypothetical protein [Human alphaherpesvirus 1]
MRGGTGSPGVASVNSVGARLPGPNEPSAPTRSTGPGVGFGTEGLWSSGARWYTGCPGNSSPDRREASNGRPRIARARKGSSSVALAARTSSPPATNGSSSVASLPTNRTSGGPGGSGFSHNTATGVMEMSTSTRHGGPRARGRSAMSADRRGSCAARHAFSIGFRSACRRRTAHVSMSDDTASRKAASGPRARESNSVRHSSSSDSREKAVVLRSATTTGAPRSTAASTRSMAVTRAAGGRWVAAAGTATCWPVGR